MASHPKFWGKPSLELLIIWRLSYEKVNFCFYSIFNYDKLWLPLRNLFIFNIIIFIIFIIRDFNFRKKLRGIWLVGGLASPSINSTIASIDLYDPVEDKWYSTVTNLPKAVSFAAARTELACVEVRDVVYHMGGRTAVTTFSNANDGYSSSLNVLTSTTETVLSAGRAGMTIGSYIQSNGTLRIFIVGGITAITGNSGNYIFNGASSTTMTNLFQYLESPFNGTWNNVSNPYPNSVAFLAGVVKSNIFYCFGGTSSHSANPVNTAYSFNLNNLSGNWSSLATMPTARFGHCAVALD